MDRELRPTRDSRYYRKVDSVRIHQGRRARRTLAAMAWALSQQTAWWRAAPSLETKARRRDVRVEPARAHRRAEIVNLAIALARKRPLLGDCHSAYRVDSQLIRHSLPPSR